MEWRTFSKKRPNILEKWFLGPCNGPWKERNMICHRNESQEEVVADIIRIAHRALGKKGIWDCQKLEYKLKVGAAMVGGENAVKCILKTGRSSGGWILLLGKYEILQEGTSCEFKRIIRACND